MKSPVIIKGNKYGFQIVLNPTLTFEELLAAVEEKFRATDRFFDENRTMAVSFEGRSLSPGEQNLLVDTITSCCRLRIGYIIEGAAAVETDFANALKTVLPGNAETEEKAPVKEDFMGLKEVIDSWNTGILIVHCGAGVSRSAGVMAAILEYLQVTDYDIFNDKRHIPNRLVYRLASQELGIGKGNEYFENVFKEEE